MFIFSDLRTDNLSLLCPLLASMGHKLMTEFVCPEIREDNHKKLILSWIGTGP